MRVEHLRLDCSDFFVELRLVEHGGRWIAVADTPDGASVGWGPHWINAAILALQPFNGRIEELLRHITHVSGEARSGKARPTD